MGTQLTEDDVGKPVETADGERVGVVASVEGATAEIDRDPGAIRALIGALGQNVDDDDERVSFGEDDIGGITDETVQLERAGDDGGAEPDAAADAGTAEDVETDPVIERDESTGEESESWGEQRAVGQGTEPADERPDEEGRSGEGLEPETEDMDEAGDERHPDTEEAPPHGDRTVTKDRGKEEDR